VVITTQPAGAVSGVPLTSQPVVQIRDASNNLVGSATNAVTVTIASGTGSVAGTTTVNAVNGVATFTNVQINGVGAHTLRFSASGLTAATSASIAVTQVAASLALQQQPTGAVSGAPLTTQPVVRVLDNGGVVASTGGGATIAVTASIASGTGSLSGTTSVNAVNGTATFTNLSLTGNGPHTLRFSTSSPSLAVVSASVAVGAGAAANIAAVTSTNQSGAVSSVVTAPAVVVTDIQGNPVSGVNVTFTVTAGGGSVVPASGASVATDANGRATLSSWTLGASPGVNTVTATATTC